MRAGAAARLYLHGGGAIALAAGARTSSDVLSATRRSTVAARFTMGTGLLLAATRHSVAMNGQFRPPQSAMLACSLSALPRAATIGARLSLMRSEEHTSELQSRFGISY